jgi:hypothetical protein
MIILVLFIVWFAIIVSIAIFDKTRNPPIFLFIVLWALLFCAMLFSCLALIGGDGVQI